VSGTQTNPAVPASSAPQGLDRSAWSALIHGPVPWIVPVVVMIGLFYLYPILDAMRLAFTDASLLDSDETYTLESMRVTLTNPALDVVLRNTFVFAAATVVGQMLCGLAIALVVINGERRRLPGMLALRTIVLAAWVIPGVANGIIWQMLFSEAPFGAINSALRLIDIAPVAWLSNPTNAMISVIIATVWQGTAFSMIIMYAALKSVDESLYEAAAVDGDTGFERFWFITLPQLRGAIVINAILISIALLNAFDVIIALTGGGPGRATEVLALFTYNTVFYSYDLAGGSVLSLMLLVITLALAFVYSRFLPDREGDP